MARTETIHQILSDDLEGHTLTYTCKRRVFYDDRIADEIISHSTTCECEKFDVSRKATAVDMLDHLVSVLAERTQALEDQVSYLTSLGQGLVLRLDAFERRN